MREDTNSLAERLAAVERAVSGGGTELAGVEDAAAFDARLSELESTVDELDDRLADLDAAVQAIRGFAGGVRAVDRDVERRADLALAKAEAIEAELSDTDGIAGDRSGAETLAVDRADADGIAVGRSGGGLAVERATADGGGALERVAVDAADGGGTEGRENGGNGDRGNGGCEDGSKSGREDRDRDSERGGVCENRRPRGRRSDSRGREESTPLVERLRDAL